MKNRDMGHNTLTCESSSANSFTLLGHEKNYLYWVKEFAVFLLYQLWLKLEFFKKNRFEIEIYSQITQSRLRRLPINLFRRIKVTQSAHF
jgi:hypothetical protein